MEIKWQGKPGDRNKEFEIEYGLSGGDIDYYFSLCTRQEPEDPDLYHVFVYPAAGWMHIGGYATIDEAKRGASAWQAPRNRDINVGA